MQSSRAQRVYSPLRFAYGYITQAIVRRAAGGGSSRQVHPALETFAFLGHGVKATVGSGQVKVL